MPPTTSPKAQRPRAQLGESDMDMKKATKLLHTLGGIGLTGAIVTHIILLSIAPEPTSLVAYAAIREAAAVLSRWLLLPSLTLVLISGLWSMAVHPPFRDTGWVLAKLLLGLSIFEGSLVSIQGPAERAARQAAAALAGEIDPATLPGPMDDEWGALWVVLSIALANVVLGVWRPRFSRRR